MNSNPKYFNIEADLYWPAENNDRLLVVVQSPLHAASLCETGMSAVAHMGEVLSSQQLRELHNTDYEAYEYAFEMGSDDAVVGRVVKQLLTFRKQLGLRALMTIE